MQCEHLTKLTRGLVPCNFVEAVPEEELAEATRHAEASDPVTVANSSTASKEEEVCSDRRGDFLLSLLLLGERRLLVFIFTVNIRSRTHTRACTHTHTQPEDSKDKKKKKKKKKTKFGSFLKRNKGK